MPLELVLEDELEELLLDDELEELLLEVELDVLLDEELDELLDGGSPTHPVNVRHASRSTLVQRIRVVRVFMGSFPVIIVVLGEIYHLLRDWPLHPMAPLKSFWTLS